MINIQEDKIILTDNNDQRLEFTADGNGDYYFTIFSKFEARSGDYYSFDIDGSNQLFGYFKSFIEQENEYMKDERSQLHKTAYFIISDNSVRIADQNKQIMESEFMKISFWGHKIRITFSEKFPSSIRINGLGRKDCYPFFIPVIDLFNVLQNLKIDLPQRRP